MIMDDKNEQAVQPVARMLLTGRIAELVEQHGSLRAAARVLDCDAGYLSRLQSGEKVNPEDWLLRRMKLRRIVSYERTDAAQPPFGTLDRDTADALVEAIAKEWDGCKAPMYDPAGNPTGEIDIGAMIRASGVPRAPAAPANPHAAPAGWALVPLTPTQAMCQAGQEKAREWPMFPLRISPIFRAMLDAAPPYCAKLAGPCPDGCAAVDVACSDRQHGDCWRVKQPDAAKLKARESA
jgi:hypothetical protein